MSVELNEDIKRFHRRNPSKPRPRPSDLAPRSSPPLDTTDHPLEPTPSIELPTVIITEPQSLVDSAPVSEPLPATIAPYAPPSVSRSTAAQDPESRRNRLLS
ncbi:hypothetical protein FRB99_000412, partial [Tulasnella sp. 403]